MAIANRNPGAEARQLYEIQDLLYVLCQSSPLCICLLAYWHSQQLHGNVVKASILRISRLNV